MSRRRRALPEGTAGTKRGGSSKRRARPAAVQVATAGAVITRRIGDPVPVEQPPPPVLRHRNLPGGTYSRT
jgi:hypothetical protein